MGGHRSRVLLAQAIVWLCLVAGSVSAAEDGRVVSGKVVIGNSAAAYVTVLLIGGNDGQRSTETGRNGEFRFDGVPQGFVTVVAIFGGSRTEVPVEDDQPVTLRLEIHPEVIRIHEAPPPPTPPKLDPKTYPRRLPSSTAHIASREWGVVWVGVLINETGRVDHAVILKSPPELELDAIAIKAAKGLRYAPGRDKHGRPTTSRAVVVFEWPAGSPYPPCKGSGPLNLDVPNAVYRDCDPPPGLEKHRLRAIRPPPGLRPRQPPAGHSY